MKIMQMVSFSLCSSIVIVISLGYLVGGLPFFASYHLATSLSKMQFWIV